MRQPTNDPDLRFILAKVKGLWVLGSRVGLCSLESLTIQQPLNRSPQNPHLLLAGRSPQLLGLDHDAEAWRLRAELQISSEHCPHGWTV